MKGKNMASVNQIKIGNGSTSTQGSSGTGSIASSGAHHTINQSIKVNAPSNSVVKNVNAGTDLNSIKADPKELNLKLVTDIGAHNAGLSSPDLGASMIGKTGGETVGELNKNKAGNALELTGAGISAAGACVSIGATVSSIITTGAISSASLGPFFWVGLIVTVVAAAVALIATAVTNDNKKMAANEEKSTQKRMAKIQNMNAKGKPDILKDGLEADAAKDAKTASNTGLQPSQPSSSVMTTMDVAEQHPVAATA